MRLEYFQMVDRVSALDPAALTISADCTVPEASPVFEGHFPGYPILPGVLMIETMAQTGGWLVMGLLRFTRMAFLAQVKEAKMRAFVAPGQVLQTEARLLHDGSGYAVAAGRILSGGKSVAEAEITYRVMPFPNETLRQELLKVARRVAVPAELFDARPDND
jgi:3-hydroxyacyl-[acyl-carrier-protein] dehydratase